jgi:glycosyltransferase involved in cell wall biosynthesis
LKTHPALHGAKLRVSGGKTGNDESFVRRLGGKLAAAGIRDDVEFLSAFDGAAKRGFLQSLSVLSVPERQPVAYGLYVLEALASGVSVVEPATGCFPETIECTGGGVLYAPNTAEKLAEAMTPLLLDQQATRRGGGRGPGRSGQILQRQRYSGPRRRDL